MPDKQETSSFRQCPKCQRNAINPVELRHGARCSACGCFVEIRLIPTIVFPFILTVLWKIAFEYGYGTIGTILVAGVVTYGISYYRITARYFPLKVVAD